MLSDKETRLLRLLVSRDEPTPAGTLAAEAGVSLRTAKAYVAQINQQCPNCIMSSRRGYQCDRQLAVELLRSQEVEPVPQTGTERRSYVMQRLLGSKDQLNVYDLCEELYVSASTLKAELPRIRSTLERFGLSLIVDGDLLALAGAEKDKRRLMSSLLYEEADVSFVNLSTISQAFPNLDTDFIERCVRETLDSFHRFANDFSIIDLVLHISITIDRIRANHMVQDSGISDEPADEAGRIPDCVETRMAQAIGARLEEHFGITCTRAEQAELSLLLASRTTLQDFRPANRDSLKRIVGADCIELVDAIIDDLKSNFGIDLSDQEFYVRFALHVKNLLLRAQYGGLSKNPLTQQIKRGCPLLYDAAVAESELLQRRTGLQINDDEIAFIAFHLGSTLETQRQLTSKIATLLYCPVYYDAKDRLVMFLECHFEEDIIVAGVVTEEAELEGLSGIDLLVTTVPLNSYYDMPVFTLGLFPGEHDLSRLRAKVEDIKRERHRDALRDSLSRLIKPEVFSLNNRRLNRDEAINDMADNLIARGYVPPAFKEQTLVRERLSSTAVGTCALPHPVRTCAFQSGISIMLSKHPIEWGGAPVELVAMLSFCRDDQETFYKVFEPLVSVFSNQTKVRRLLRATSYQEFMALLCELVD